MMRRQDRPGHRLPSFAGYLSKVFDFRRLTADLRDARTEPDFSPPSVFLSVFHGFVFRLRSFQQLQADLSQPAFQHWIGAPRALSDDVLRYSLCGFDLAKLERMLVHVNRTTALLVQKVLRFQAPLLHQAPQTFGVLAGPAEYRHRFRVRRTRGSCAQCPAHPRRSPVSGSHSAYYRRPDYESKVTKRLAARTPLVILVRLAAPPNQPLVSTILPSTEPDARSSMACLASRSGNVRLTRGSIFFSARSLKILGRSSRSGLGSFRYSIVIP